MPFSCNLSFLSHSSAELNLCAGPSHSQVSTGEKDRCNALCSKFLLIFLRLLEASEDVPRISFCAVVGVMGRACLLQVHTPVVEAGLAVACGS